MVRALDPPGAAEPTVIAGLRAARVVVHKRLQAAEPTVIAGLRAACVVVHKQLGVVAACDQ